jgi:heme oxygenase (biliverdin-IX-beta and delta-forming)
MHTQPLHQALDARLDTSKLSSRPGYVAFLLANWPFASIEPALELAGIHRILPDWEQRRRRGALASDLEHLAVSPPVRARDQLVIAPDQGTLLGWSYVLEGSRLGALMILQIINRGATQEMTSATTFLRHGADGHFWRIFRTALSAIDHDSAAILKACAGADAAFQCFMAES